MKRNDFFSLSRSSIQDLKSYQTARLVSEQELAENPRIIQLSSNENSLGPSKKIQATLETTCSNIWRYPDPNGIKLKHLLAMHLKIEVEQITLGNGSLELISLLIQTFVEPQEEVIISKYAYAFYETCIKTAEGKPIICPDRDWGHNLQAMLENITASTKLIIIANPNNPTGTYLSHQEVEDFLKHVPWYILVIIDEAYYEYVLEAEYANSLKLQKSYPNLVITRSFSKVYGLAGLRLGYSISDPQIVTLINRARIAFNVNIMAIEAGCIALSDQEHVFFVKNYIKKERNYLISELKKLDVEFLPPSANFITLKFADSAQEIFDRLLARGVVVRQLLNYNMPNCLRVTIGKHEENVVFVDVLTEALNQNSSSQIRCLV